jgi:hypothetical protein
MGEGVAERNPAETLFTPRHCREGRDRMVLDVSEMSTMLKLLDLREQLVVRLATWEGL